MRFIKLFYIVLILNAVMFLNCAYAGEINRDIIVKDAWVQAMPPIQKVSAAYMTIANNSQKEAVLVSVSSDMVGVAEIHQMSKKKGIMHMAKVANVHIPAHGKVALQPGSFHIMLINLKKPVNSGDIVPITLHFQDGDNIKVNANVRDQ